MERHKREVPKERPLQWHPANYAGLQIELAEEKEFGIYYLQGDIIPIQFIVSSKLSSKENLWLKGLTNQLKDFELTTALAEDYQKHKKNTLYQSAMDIIMRANKQQFEEAKNMCEAMREWIREEYADEIEEAEKIAVIRTDSLNIKLSELGRNDDILKAATNPEYKKQLFQEFGI